MNGYQACLRVEGLQQRLTPVERQVEGVRDDIGQPAGTIRVHRHHVSVIIELVVELDALLEELEHRFLLGLTGRCCCRIVLRHLIVILDGFHLGLDEWIEAAEVPDSDAPLSLHQDARAALR